MIDHISIPVSNLRISAAFYDRVLEPLGLKRLTETDRTVGYGKRYPEFWLNLRERLATVDDDTGLHVALRAPDPQAVIEFHARAVADGGRSDGEPGPRKAAVTDYFGAFIRDPDGNKIEALTFPRG
ncbi:MAG: VOC family protein [Gammaproteobacteria bacterium]|nr:VOC family protein [Gammaproteobacteria bacterium]